MNYRKFNHTELSVSEICLGTMQFLWTANEHKSYEVLDAFFDAGGNFIDTADMYTSWAKGLKGGEAETIIGNWMKRRKNRGKIVLATKVRGRMWEGEDGEGLSKSHILKACEQSLMRLQTDFIDLYQSHWPDPKTPIEETLEAYKTLTQAGKVRWLGCSNYSGNELKELMSAGEKVGAMTVSVQPRYSLLHRKVFEEEVLPIVSKYQMAVLAYSPLEGGFLTGKYKKDKPLPRSERAVGNKEKMTEKNFQVLECLEKVGKKYDKTISQIALAWLLSHEWLTAPVIGANNKVQLNENLGAVGLTLEPEDKKMLDEISQGF